ncbi:Motility protein FimV [Acidithiobacillus sp. MC6.1]|nr:Motility protein FimV [Acidithiobacillus sp. MC6.1]
MMDRKNWLWVMAGMGLLLPGMAQALGLGGLHVLSAPGEPFRAEISIQSLNPQSEASLSAGLAPASAFAMINLPKAGALDQWHFTVRSGDRPAILISSPLPLPLAQPALHFLVQMDWSGGQMVREYAAYNAGANVVSAPRTMMSAPQTSTSPTMLQPGRHAAPARIYHGWSRVNRYGPVPVNGSLFQAAQDITRSSAVTLDQVMAALVKANPRAFKDGNPTYLYAGSMLMVPSLAQVQSVSPAQASTWLSAQHANSVSVATAPAATPPVIAPAAAVAAAVKTAGNSTHLVLSSAPAAAATAVVASAASAATTGQLPVADTVLRDDNQKLMVEVASLGQRLNAEARLLASQEVQLATLSRTTGNSSLFNDFPLLISLGGNILLLLLFLWMLRRQKEAEQRQREISQRISTLSAAPKEASPQPQSPTSVLSAAPPPVVSPPSSVQPAAVGAPIYDALPGLALSVNHPEESAKDAYAGAEVDPLEQADLYLTYGKAEQAVSVLNESLEANPRRKELYVKLLDIYANLDRHEAYLDLAERMRGRFGPHNAVWQEVALQGARLFPGNALFASAAETTATVPEPVTEIPLPAEPVEESAAHAPLDMLDFHFGHTPVEPAAAAEEEFPPEEKARLLQNIDEQFRLMDETRGTSETLDVDSNSEESPTAWEAPAAAPLFGLVRPDEPSTPTLPAAFSAAVESPATGEAYAAQDVADWDAVGTKLDLAKAYVEMGEGESARDLLMEVTREGSSAQQEEARQLLKTL